MQFHLNGFRPGDPHIAEPADGYNTQPRGGGLPEEVDVLIIGSGPAGLTLAAQLASFPQIRTRIIEQKSGKLLRGQADGIACRTMEVFEALGFSERVLNEAYWVNETTFWQPAESHPETIVRNGRIQDTEDGLSEFPHVILNQARVHDFLLDLMWNSPTRLAPDYGRRLVGLTIDPDLPDGNGEPARAVTARIMRVDSDHEGEIETVRAHYVVGCDGAHSTVRKSIGRAMEGDSANRAWGVMDVLAVTNFPDIRLKTLIQSAAEGSLLIIPREGGYMVRMYIELDENERVASRNITVGHLIEAAQRVLHPYSLEVKEVPWWSVYEIGQRLCGKFDDVSEAEIGSRVPHVFLVGDASHTHSPKAGQGMNVAIRDAFNLGWKIATVLLGRSSPTILHTYSAERQAVAKELIDFDRVFARLISTRPKTADEADEVDGVDPAEFQRYFVRQSRYTAGTTIQYQPSIITAEPTHQSLAEGMPIGKRFHSAPVIRLADAKPVELGHVIKADGRWRLLAFAGSGDPTTPDSEIARLCDFLDEAPDSPIRRYTPEAGDPDSVIDVRAVFQQDHRSLPLEAMPPFLLPRKGRYGLCDYEKMFCPDLKGGRDVFDIRDLDRASGCIVVVRPDQHVAHVLPLDAHTELAAFFEAFMKPYPSKFRGRAEKG